MKDLKSLKKIVIKNKNKFLVTAALVFSLSGAVVFAEVANQDLQTESNNQVHTVETSVSTEEIQVAKTEATITTVEIEETVEPTEEAVEPVNTKVVSENFSELAFGKIGSLSSKDVQIGISTAKSSVNIRESASKDSKVVGKLYKDEAAAVLDINDGWVQVESGSVKGYVTTDYINTDLTKDEVIENYGKLKASITVNGLNVREEADENAKVVTVVYEDEKYNIKETQDEWYKISLSKGKEGYISAKYADASVSFEQAISIEEEIKLQKEKEEKERKEKEKKEKERKEKEAAEKKKKEAEKKKSSSKKSSTSSKKSSTSSKKSSTSSNSSTKTAKPKQTGSEKAAKEEIARRESNGNYNARNGKYIGRYQLTNTYLNGDHSPENQERVADKYVANRYGTWQKALKFWDANGWY